MPATASEIKHIGVLNLPHRYNRSRMTYYRSASVRIKDGELQVMTTNNIPLPQGKDPASFQNSIALAVEGLDEAKINYVVAAYGEESVLQAYGWATADEDQIATIQASGKLG